MVSAVDFVPTLLDVMEHEHPTPEILHGRSFAPLLDGTRMDDRDFVILQYNENAGRNRHPMRGIHTREMLYLYNPWSDGTRKFATATTGTHTYKQMVKRAANEPEVAARLDLFDHRVVEELYDVKNDPDCLVNLVGDPNHQQELAMLRARLAASLQEMQDPVAPLLAAHEDVSLRQAYMAAEDELTRQWRASNRNKKSRTQKKLKLISIDPPTKVSRQARATIVIHHELPKRMGEQRLHVTLKGGDNKRIHREIVAIRGTGDARIAFDIPDIDAIHVSAFVGADYESNLQHITTESIPVD